MTNLERWRFYNDNTESPLIYLDWGFYSMISHALQRRVWWGEGRQLFPNQYIIFIGRPGLGKSIAADGVMNMFSTFFKYTSTNENNIGTLRSQAPIKIIPETVTPERLVEYSASVISNIEIQKENPIPRRQVPHCSISILNDEIGTLISQKDREVITFMTKGYDCKDYVKETKNNGSDNIRNVCINILGAATPEWVKGVVDNQILKEGFASRTIFIYASRKRKLVENFNVTPDQQRAFTEIANHVSNLIKPTYYGEVKPTKEALDYLHEWYVKNDGKPLNNSKALEHYYARKRVHIIKLAMAMHFADRLDLIITKTDIENAIQFLNRTERSMHLALAGAGKNEAYQLSEAIMEHLFHSGPQDTPTLILKFFTDADPDLIMKVIAYLFDNNRINFIQEGSKKLWCLTKAEMEVYADYNQED